MAPSGGPRDPCGQQYHDSARSWVVALACSWTLFWTLIMTRCGGIIFVTLLNEMGASRETASWPFNLQGAIINVSSIVTGVLLRNFPLRAISLAGALLTALGVLLCAVFYDIVGISISYGVICAIGQGLTLPSNNFAVNTYFKRRDVMAVGFLVMGLSLVGLIYANSMASFVLVSVLFGLVCGSILILFGVITVEYLGLQNLPLALSFHSLARAIVAIPRPFVIGYYRDRRESYTGLYVLLALSCFVIGLIWTAECFMKWRSTRRRQEEQIQFKQTAA
ncbi:monocarboxylate transporter 6-like isoform X2 [Haemaphysalis longicornis]